MASLNDIMLAITAKDNASSTFNSISSNAQNMGVSASSAISTMAVNLTQVRDVAEGIISSFTGKSISDTIFGTSSTAETNKILLNNMTETKEAAESLYTTVDKVTDSSLISMQELIPVMKAFKSATGATDEELASVTDEIANFGASVLATTGSTELAKTAMEKLSYGIKGSYAALDQYGITEESLMRTGLWSGKEDDVKGYMAAIEAVTGSTEELMDTNTGLDAQISKAFSRSGKQIGNFFLPAIKSAKQGFLEFNNVTGGALTTMALLGTEAISVSSSIMEPIATTMNGVNGLIQGWQNLSPALGKVGSKLGLVSSGVKEVGAAAAEAGIGGGVAGAEAAGASVGLSGFASGVMSMLVPLLQVSVVIAIMIPVVTALAAEALLFVKLLGEFMQSLNFDSLNLDGAISGLKSIGTAVWELAKTMGAMTLTAALVLVFNYISAFASGFGLLGDPIKQAVEKIKKVTTYLNELTTVAEINPGITDKLNSLSTALKAVSDAMSSMTSTTLTVFAGNLVTLCGVLGTLNSNLQTAADDLAGAVDIINKMQLGTVDQGKVTALKNVCDALKSISEAVKASTDVNWNEGFGRLFGGGGTGGLQSAIKDIQSAANYLKGLNISDIPEGIGAKIKNVADALTSIKSAISSLGNLNWDEGIGRIFGGGGTGGLQTAITDLQNAANAIKNLRLGDIPEDINTKINVVSDAVKNIKTTMTNMQGIPANNPQIVTNITNAVSTIKSIATELNKLGGQQSVDVSAIITSINDAITQMKTCLQNAGTGMQSSAVNIGQGITTGVQSGLSGLSGVLSSIMGSAMGEFSSVAVSGATSAGSQSSSAFSSSLTLDTVMQQEMAYVKQAVDSGISAAKTAAQNGAADIVQAFKDGINTGSPGDIAWAMYDEMWYTIDFIKSETNPLIKAARFAGQKVVQAFGNPTLGISTNLNTNLNSQDIKTLAGLNNSNINELYSQNNGSTEIHIHEGAIKLDARNLTTRESKQILINALEGLDSIKSVYVKQGGISS